MEAKTRIIEMVKRCNEETKINMLYQFAIGLLNNAATPKEAGREEQRAETEQ